MVRDKGKDKCMDRGKGRDRVTVRILDTVASLTVTAVTAIITGITITIVVSTVTG